MGNESAPAPVLAFVSTKGGLGRSMLTLGLATELALMGYRTLVVDLDPNHGCTSRMMSRGRDQELSADETAARLLLHPELGCSGIIHKFSLSTLIESTESNASVSTGVIGRRKPIGAGTLDFIPGIHIACKGTALLRDVDAHGAGLRDSLSRARPNYDVVLLDTPSSGNRLVDEIYDTADHLLLLYDMYEGSLAQEDYLRLLRRVDEERDVRAQRGRPAQYNVVVRIERGPEVTAREIARQSRAIIGPMFNTIIPYDRPAALQRPPQAQAPTSPLSQALARLAADVIAYVGLRQLSQ